MMKALEYVKRILLYLLSLCMLLQISMGIYWMTCNILFVPKIRETKEYLEAAKGFLLDEYMGILYPLFLRCLLSIEKVIGLPYWILVYLIQLLLSSAVLWLFLRKLIQDRKKRLFVLLYLMTIPMLLQYHMSVLPNSLLFSISILLILTGIKIGKKNQVKGREILVLCVLWVAAALLHPDYLLIHGAWILIYLLFFFIKGYKKKEIKCKLTLKIILCFIGSLVFIMFVNGLTQTPGSHGKMQRSMESILFERLVGQNFANTYTFWSSEVKNTISLEEAVQIAKRSDNLRYEAGPVLEAALGKEQANREYLDMAFQCFGVRTKETTYRMLDDFMDYLFSPFSLLSRDGNRISAAGWNYALLREHNPRLVKWYFGGSLNVMIFGCILTLLAFCEKLFKKQKIKPIYGWILLFMLIEAFWFTISSSNANNYGNVLFIIFFYYVLGLYTYIKKGNI